MLKIPLCLDEKTWMLKDSAHVLFGKYFHASNQKTVIYSHKLNSEQIFFDKMLACKVLDEAGTILKPFLCTLEWYSFAKSIWFISLKKHYKTDEIIFWSHMVSPCYTKNVTGYLISQKIELQEKSENAADVIKVRWIK